MHILLRHYARLLGLRVASCLHPLRNGSWRLTNVRGPGRHARRPSVRRQLPQCVRPRPPGKRWRSEGGLAHELRILLLLLPVLKLRLLPDRLHGQLPILPLPLLHPGTPNAHVCAHLHHR